MIHRGVDECRIESWSVAGSDGIVLYPYDKRMCYFDAVIEEF